MKKINLKFRTVMLAAMASIGFAASAEPVTVNVETAGTLASKISDADKYSITELKVTGPLSDSDIYLLREMAGKKENNEATEGKLVSLDLSEASIVANENDKTYYYRASYNNKTTSDNTVGIFMFSGLNLQTILLPSSVTKIDDNAFQNSKITSLAIPESVTSIGGYVCENCKDLTKATLGSVPAVGQYMFKGCDKLAEVDIPETVTKIDYNAFQGCGSLEKLTLPSKLASIAFWSFKDASLKELHSLAVTPPTCSYGSLEGIDKEKCKIYVPKGSVGAYASVQYWSDYAGIIEEESDAQPSDPSKKVIVLTEAGTLSAQIPEAEKYLVTDLTVSGPLNGSDLAFIREMAGIDFSWNKTIGKLVRLDMSGANLVYEGTYDEYGIRQPVESDYYAYHEASIGGDDPIRMAARQDALPELVFTKTNLEEVVMPNSIKKIYSSFSGCSNLKGTVVIPEGVTTIGDYAFEGCGKIEEVVFPSTLKEPDTANPAPNESAICSHAFDGCVSLKSITFPESVTNLRDAAFQNCSGLTSLYIPSSIKKIGQMTFGNCVNISKIEVESAIPANAYYQAFYGMDKDNCVLLVPKGSRDAYKAASEWSEFINIMEEGDAMEFTVNVDKASNVKVTFGSEGKELTLVDGKNTIQMQDYKNPLTVTPIDGYNASLVLNGTVVDGNTVAMGIGYVLDITTAQKLEEAEVKFVTKSADGMEHVSITCNGKAVEFADGATVATLPIGATVVLAPAENYRLSSVKVNDVAAVENNGQYSIEVTGDLTVSFDVDLIDGGVANAISERSIAYDRASQSILTSGCRAEIYTTTGRLVGVYEDSNIDVSGLAHGVYIVKTESATFKFVR